VLGYAYGKQSSRGSEDRLEAVSAALSEVVNQDRWLVDEGPFPGPPGSTPA
jgi:hypothetical protein